MRAARASDIGVQYFTKSLHLLDTGRVGECYIGQLVARCGGSNIRSKRRNAALPTEIWNMIIKLLKADSRRSEYCFVRASALPSTNSSQRLICCTRYNFDKDLSEYLLAGNLDSKKAVRAFGDFLIDPDRFPVGEDGQIHIEDAYNGGVGCVETGLELPALNEMSGPGNVFYVALLDEKKNEGVIPCLMVDVDILDVIAFIDDGDCRVCDGLRSICPGCTSGVAHEFGVFMGCGVDLACPLCMGLDLAVEHHGFLKERYHLHLQDADGDDSEAEDMMERVLGRAKELGYGWNYLSM
ncbi:hypothetical protein B0T25DRAFT_578590 [Lasiosphaeria hispida]|uniref:Uncharacterized protein n=1 Tax=Lasiosphaeria hispida TaxID=260671 RepID=A0AAJ0HSP1_9PEZI|nr:hypothetical protein B0T25DRAFT_578590 [Lasiosphaeria hispida]